MAPSDLELQRAAATFDPEEVTCLLRGGAQALKRQREIRTAIEADEVLGKGRLHEASWSREDQYVAALRRAARLNALGLLGKESSKPLRLHREGGLVEKGGALQLHSGMFIPTIQLLGSEEQRAKWLPLCLSCAIIGTYAQVRRDA